MDVNAMLAEVRAILARGQVADLTPADSHRLVELVAALDRWITRGGFLPAAWLALNLQGSAAEQENLWWWVRPVELAIRFGGDAGKLLDTIDPEHLTERQFELVMAAKLICERWMDTMMNVEE